MIPNKEIMAKAFALSCLAGVRFSKSLAHHISCSGHTKADIAELAQCTERQVKACVQQQQIPSKAIRDAMEKCLGFDPWQIHAEVKNKTYRMSTEDHLTLNQVEAEYYAGVAEEAAPYLLNRDNHND